MESELDVGIVGCGFAGSATAILLARSGHRVTLYERVAEPTAVGAGILLQPTGLAVLAELGVLAGLLARGARVEGLACRTTRGKTLFSLRYADLAPELFGLGTHRGLLFELLYAELQRANVELRCGTEVTRLAADNQRARLHGEQDELIGEHDLVVVADGARSKLRAGASALVRSRAYGWGALWFVGADPNQVFNGTLSQVCQSTSRMLGFLPTGLGPGSAAQPLVSLFWSVRMDRVDAWRRGGLARWKQEILAHAPQAEPLLAQIEDIDQVLTASYVDVVMQRWHEPRVVYVGDAAHAMSPQLGQGTNLALIDAAVLSRCLNELPDLPSALSEYTRGRRAQLGFYQFASRWLTPLFQSDQRWLAPLRDALLPLATRISPFRVQMLRTMAGVKRGIFRTSLELAPIREALALPAGSAVRR